jgi:hypothetical protein
MKPISITENPMYIEKSIHIDKKGTVHTYYFLRQSRREGQKIIKTTILNITNWGEKNYEAFADNLNANSVIFVVAIMFCFLFCFSKNMKKFLIFYCFYILIQR